MNKLIKDSNHKIPVLWSLYRPLIKLTKPFPLIKFEIKQSFRRYKLIRNLPKIKLKLLEGYTMLSDLLKAQQGNLYYQTKLNNLSTHLSKVHHRAFTPPPSPSSSTSKKFPRLLPGVIYSTPYNPPLPRLKPQPNHITMLIFNRRKSIQRRWNLFQFTKLRIEEGREENKFLERLGIVREEKDGLGSEWRVLEKSIRESMGRETSRNLMRIPPRLVKGSTKANLNREKRRSPSQLENVDKASTEATNDVAT